MRARTDMETITIPAAGYRFIKGGLPYSAGVAAEPGWEIERARFWLPVPLAAGFRSIEEHLRRAGRPLAALCACELRSPTPFSEGGFTAFNRRYADVLEGWGLLRDGVNPVARSNVCPEINAPAEPSFYAFSYTVTTSANAGPTFVISGSGEVPEGCGTYEKHIVRRGDTSPSGLLEKAVFVLGEMERRMSALGFGWPQATGTQMYTVCDVHPFFRDEIVLRGAAPAGLTWHFARPPVEGLEFEMDVRGVARECVL